MCGYLSNSAWAYRLKWEKIHWFAFERVRNQVQFFELEQSKFDEVGITLNDYMSSSVLERNKHWAFADRIYRMKKDNPDAGSQ